MMTSRIPPWTTILVVVAALVASAILLWAGLLLAICFSCIAVVPVLRSWMRRLWTHRAPRNGPVTIEGEYRKDP
jgi:hypothetical protein